MAVAMSEAHGAMAAAFSRPPPTFPSCSARINAVGFITNKNSQSAKQEHINSNTPANWTL
jgi:hypothetical protein